MEGVTCKWKLPSSAPDPASTLNSPVPYPPSLHCEPKGFHGEASNLRCPGTSYSHFLTQRVTFDNQQPRTPWAKGVKQEVGFCHYVIRVDVFILVSPSLAKQGTMGALYFFFYILFSAYVLI